MQNLLVLLIVVVVVMFLCTQVSEKFSTSGMTISDDYCDKLASYYKPNVTDPALRAQYHDMICGRQRRNTITGSTGNYYTHYGVLV